MASIGVPQRNGGGNLPINLATANQVEVYNHSCYYAMYVCDCFFVFFAICKDHVHSDVFYSLVAMHLQSVRTTKLLEVYRPNQKFYVS